MGGGGGQDFRRLYKFVPRRPFSLGILKNSENSGEGAPASYGPVYKGRLSIKATFVAFIDRFDCTIKKLIFSHTFNFCCVAHFQYIQPNQRLTEEHETVPTKLSDIDKEFLMKGSNLYPAVTTGQYDLSALDETWPSTERPSMRFVLPLL